MSILEIISQETGLQFKKAATTGGGEYQGPCPWCGGNDRFIIHLGRGLFWCRKCERSGDAIRFLINYCALSYPNACQRAGIAPSTQSRPLSIKNTDSNNHQFTPATPSNSPCAAWQNKMQSILFQAFKALLSANGAATRGYLLSRGITPESIKRFRLGWMQAPATFDIDDEPTRVPAGILIPWFHSGKLFRIRCRVDREHPVQQSAMAAKFSPYQIVKGCPGDPMLIPSSDPTSKIYMVVESELDGILIHQEAGDLINVLALGSSTARPNIDQWAALSGPGAKIIISLDNDISGESQTAWWLNRFQHDGGKITVNYPPTGKDPGEMISLGVAIRPWVEVAIKQFSGGNWVAVSLRPNVFPADTEHDKKLIGSSQADQADQVDQPPPSTIRPICGWPNHYQDTNQVCLHGKFCPHLSRIPDPAFPEIIQKICLVKNISIFQLADDCPKRKWGRWENFF